MTQRLTLTREAWLAEGKPQGIADDAIRMITAKDYMQHAHSLLTETNFQLAEVESLDAFPAAGSLTLRVCGTGCADRDAAIATALDEGWDRSLLPINFRLYIEPMHEPA
jgi:hypothetical protein